MERLLAPPGDRIRPIKSLLTTPGTEIDQSTAYLRLLRPNLTNHKLAYAARGRIRPITSLLTTPETEVDQSKPRFSLTLEASDAHHPVLQVLHHLREHETEGTQANLPVPNSTNQTLASAPRYRT